MKFNNNFYFKYIFQKYILLTIGDWGWGLGPIPNLPLILSKIVKFYI